ncbi:MAG: histidinol-phosphate transaminase [Thiothrix sp.]|nr:histidinol-phosphate transaminase [Thiothrix sp.]
MQDSPIDYQSLAVRGVQALQPYQPGKPMNELERELGIRNSLKLASNENPLGPSPRALAAITPVLKSLELYPDGGGFRLKAALADWLGVSPAQITLGNGSNDVLDIIGRCFLDPSRGAVFSEHAFAVYPIVTQSIGAALQVAKALPPDHPEMPYGHDLSAMRAQVDEKTRLIFIANPNNPTGTWLTGDALRAFLQALPANVIVVVDEAYIEYVEREDVPDSLAWLDEFPNLIVTRTFSKIYGLAGLRVGYAVSSPTIANLLNRVRQPFNVNALALVAAEAALSDEAHLRRSAVNNATGLQQWFAACAGQGWGYIPTIGNFISVDTGRTAAPVYQALLREGVIVRPVANYGLPRHLRITIGTEAQNARCIQALRKVLAEPPADREA